MEVYGYVLDLGLRGNDSIRGRGIDLCICLIVLVKHHSLVSSLMQELQIEVTPTSPLMPLSSLSAKLLVLVSFASGYRIWECRSKCGHGVVSASLTDCSSPALTALPSDCRR